MGNHEGLTHSAPSDLNIVILASNCSTFFSRFFIPARNSSRLSPLRTVWTALRVRSDTLRAPVNEQRCRSAEYSSSERRILIMRERGFKTVMPKADSKIDGENHPGGVPGGTRKCIAKAREIQGWKWRVRKLLQGFGTGFAPLGPRLIEGLNRRLTPRLDPRLDP